MVLVRGTTAALVLILIFVGLPQCGIIYEYSAGIVQSARKLRDEIVPLILILMLFCNFTYQQLETR